MNPHFRTTTRPLSSENTTTKLANSHRLPFTGICKSKTTTRITEKRLEFAEAVAGSRNYFPVCFSRSGAAFLDESDGYLIMFMVGGLSLVVGNDCPYCCETKMNDIKGSTSADADICALHKQWDEISCPICMDHPHNAVLLICSSHDKGCRAYICDTSYRHSNCLDRFKKLRSSLRNNPSQTSSSFLENSDSERQGQQPHSLTPGSDFEGSRMRINLLQSHEGYRLEENNNGISAGILEPLEENNSQDPERHLEAQGQERMDLGESGGGNMSEPNGVLKCPMCRGTVLRWKIEKEARQYLDLKPRGCSRESCSFSGNYRELRRHARRVHPTTRPADVDPSRQRAWRRLEHQREYGDILSAIRSAMPDAIVLGDYVIDNGDRFSRDRETAGSSEGSGPWWTTFFLFHMISPLGHLDEPRRSSRAWRTHRRSSGHRNLWGENLLGLQDDDDDGNLDDDDIPVPRRRRRFTRSRPDDELP